MKKKNLVYTHGSGGCIKKKKKCSLDEEGLQKEKKRTLFICFQPDDTTSNQRPHDY